jgi:RNA-directed DNA polymerase
MKRRTFLGATTASLAVTQLAGPASRLRALDAYVWKLICKWATHTHPKKPKHWVTARYFGVFNKARRDRWVFGDRDSGRYLTKFSWTKIVRHQMVRGTSSVDDPALADYWRERRRKHKPAPAYAREPSGLA